MFIKLSGKKVLFNFTFSQKIYLKIKRIFDIILSLFAIILLSPLIVIVSILIKLTSKGPAIFSQKRIGKDEKLFNIYKFRSMYKEAPKNIATGNLEDPHTHITKIGKILRVTSIDEIPQLFNVLKGDMSLIGPRPIIPEEVEVYNLRKENNVYAICPGITGLAQVNGRDFLNPEKKVRFDTEYLKNLSLKMDIYIILKSIVVVFTHADFFEGKINKK